MSDVVRQIPEVGSHLCDIRLRRMADGAIVADVIRMAPALIETTGNETPERLRIIAGWMTAGLVHIQRFAMQLQIESQTHGR